MRVIVIGGGFAGIYAVRALQRWSDAEVMLIEPRDRFVFTPLLHEVAVDVLHEPSVTHRYASIFHKHFRHIVRRAVRVNADERWVETDDGSRYEYDYCIVATGSTTRLPGALPVMTLKSLEDACAIRARLAKARSAVIIGGGPTGVELAAEIADYFHRRDVRGEVTLIHSRDSLLPGEDSRIQQAALDTLREKGISVVLGRRVETVRDGEVLAGKRYRADIAVWTAGVRPVGIRGLSEDGIAVRETLQVKSHDRVFAVGDTSGHAPTLAQAAVQQGTLAARNVLRHHRGKPLKPYRFRQKGFLVSLGQKNAAGTVYGFFIRGFPAWFIWRTVYLVKFIGVKSKLRMMKEYTIRLFRYE